ncbi:hypothetical protein [Candidatus Uabimicrobium sp. HlEnr_7]|uniref:hypothetical protein n=1 Tax=Candidatus Uabimicrobium helgolandensis TaxID=3095367 RepID=UPI0035587809
MFKNKFLALVIILYIGSYCIWSRIAIQQSEVYGFTGQYFFIPEPTWQWRVNNYSVVMMYYPLIFIDDDFHIACEPSYSLQRGN